MWSMCVECGVCVLCDVCVECVWSVCVECGVCVVCVCVCVECVWCVCVCVWCMGLCCVEGQLGKCVVWSAGCAIPTLLNQNCSSFRSPQQGVAATPTSSYPGVSYRQRIQPILSSLPGICECGCYWGGGGGESY